MAQSIGSCCQADRGLVDGRSSGLTTQPAVDYIVKLGSNQPTRWMAGFAPALLIENRGRDV
jgi:hypothetical protein